LKSRIFTLEPSKKARLKKIARNKRGLSHKPSKQWADVHVDVRTREFT
jgi:hypothetical protein